MGFKSREEHILKNAGLRFFSAIVVLCVAVSAIFALTRERSAVAATTGTVVVHIYDPARQYSSLGVWMWVGDGAGVECVDTGVTQSDEILKYESGAYSNIAHTFEYTASDTDMAKLKSGVPIGIIVCHRTGTSGDFWARYEKDIQEDIYVDVSRAFRDGKADVYYIRKKTKADTIIVEAMKALNSVPTVRFNNMTSSGITVAFESDKSLAGTSVDLYKNGNKIESAVAAQNADKTGYSANFTKVNAGNFDFTAKYELYTDTADQKSGITVSSAALLDGPEFMNKFESAQTQGLEYGAVYSKSNTVFRVWAPIASGVKLRIYEKGSGGLPKAVYDMQMRSGAEFAGVWEYTLDGDNNGVYYTYVVDNYGKETETIDPYAKACGVNGARAMVVDLSDTDPIGWEKDSFLYSSNPSAADIPIVWELQVSDFSSSSDSGMRYKGKYLAFTEENTHVPGAPNIKTGVAYLKDLGITYVHLNPVYDFATVDENDMSIADNTKDNFNWGYDPQNFNIPEGSYSTDPHNGAVRIKEFKQMVMALHKAGIGVIMDVVYNHTYTAPGQTLHDTVPYYYHRTNANGSFSDGSACSNETASERSMVRKYIIESIVYWAKEYHIDGFRFDLMGLHDLVTITKVREALDALDDGNGKKILIYGEPWSADGWYIPPSFTARITATGESNNSLIKVLPLDRLPARVAVFNDVGRDGIRGNNSPGRGWVQGESSLTGNVAALMNGTAKGLGLGSRNVAYASAHDNYPLWDQVIGKPAGTETPLFYENAMAYAVRQCKLASSAYMMSPGIAFMLAGEEMGRTKYGNHNSYNSPSKLNQIVWSRQAEFAELYEHYKKLIKARKDNALLFSYEKASATESIGNWFSAEGLTVSGTRGNITVKLNAGDGESYVKIDGTSIVSF